MNEEQLIEFVNWLPSVVPEFKNAEPEQIVQALNQMYESEEGQQMLSQLFTAFQESKADAQSQMFKKGGKLSQLVEKAKKGKKMCCKKKAILQGGMINKVAEKMQDGGETPALTRREARERAAANRGFSRGQFQTAVANAKNALRGTGLRGRDLRQQARQMVAGEPEFVQANVAVPEIPVMSDNIIIEDIPVSVPDMQFNFKSEPMQDLELLGTFNQAFRAARNSGAKEFIWRGNRYNTNLASEETPENENYTDKVKGATVSAKLSRDQWNDLYRQGKVRLQDIPRQYQSWIEGENSEFKQGITDAIDRAGKTAAKVGAGLALTLGGIEAAPLIARGVGTVGKGIYNLAKSSIDDFARIYDEVTPVAKTWRSQVIDPRTRRYTTFVKQQARDAAGRYGSGWQNVSGTSNYMDYVGRTAERVLQEGGVIYGDNNAENTALGILSSSKPS